MAIFCMLRVAVSNELTKQTTNECFVVVCGIKVSPLPLQYFSFCMFVFISLLFVSSCSLFFLLFCRQSHLLSSIRITKPSLTERIVLEIADICFLSCIQSYFSRFGVEQRKHNSFIHQVFLFLHRETQRDFETITLITTWHRQCANIVNTGRLFK